MGAMVNLDYKNVDIYAYAMIIFYIWTGEKPWNDVEASRIETLVLTGKRPELSPEFMKINIYIADLIQACWNHDPTRRPSSREIVEKLQLSERNK